MSDQPGTAEAFPDKLHIFRRDRKMTFGDHVNHDPNDWQAYIRADAVQAQIDAAVMAERERCAERFANHDFIRMKQYAGGWRHDVYAVICNGDQP
jgi:hypothetical protein